MQKKINAICNICVINPIFIRQYLEQYYKWLSLYNQANLQKFFSFFEQRGFMEDEHIMKLFNSIIQKNKTFSVNNIEKSLYYMDYELFIQKIETFYDFSLFPLDLNSEKFLWNIYYYTDNINNINHVSNKLGFFSNLDLFFK